MELKNGETYNGHMVQCDTWMNVHLREVICTSKVFAGHVFQPMSSGVLEVLCSALHTMQEGDRFWRMPETYIRGNTIKYVRVPPEV